MDQNRYGHFYYTIAVWVALTVGVKADTLTYTAELNGTTEVPPTESTATGTLTATYDTTSRMLSWKGSYLGLSGDATSAHFHGPADVGANAGVLIPIASFKSPFNGTSGLTDTLAGYLTSGKLYLNIHTAKNPSGEIRGQLVADK